MLPFTQEKYLDFWLSSSYHEERPMLQKEKIQKELLKEIYKKIIQRMIGPNGETFGGGSKDFIEGLITAYRIVESCDPKPEAKFESKL